MRILLWFAFCAAVSDVTNAALDGFDVEGATFVDIRQHKLSILNHEITRIHRKTV